MLRPSSRSAAIIGALINALISYFLSLVYADFAFERAWLQGQRFDFARIWPIICRRN
jgi:hypothetical protein